MFKINEWGIKKRTRLGCIVLACILFFSSIISIFEFSRVNSYVKDLVSDNVQSITASHTLMQEADSYNLRLLYGINSDDIGASFINDAGILDSFTEVMESLATAEERISADSVRFAYAAYMQVVNEAPRVWLNEPTIRREWYYSRLQPVYVKLNYYIQQLTFASQGSLVSNSQTLQEGYYRGMMPALISVIFGMLIVLLFDYYINYYLINPILKISRSVKNYRKYGKPYDVRLEQDDELSQLNGDVKDVIDLNQSYKKQLGL